MTPESPLTGANCRVDGDLLPDQLVGVQRQVLAVQPLQGVAIERRHQDVGGPGHSHQ